MTPLSTQSVPGDADHEVSGRYSQIDELAPVPTKRNTHGTYTIQGPGYPRSIGLYRMGLTSPSFCITTSRWIVCLYLTPVKRSRSPEEVEGNLNLLDGSKIY